VRFSAGRLNRYCNVWKQAGSSNIVLAAVKGFQLKFNARPPLVIPSQVGTAYSTPVSADMDKYVQELLDLDAIVAVDDDSPSFISPMFLVPKPPPSEIPRALHELQRASGTFLVVVPVWTQAFWRSDLASMASGTATALPPQPIIDTRTRRPPLHATNMKWEIFRVRR